MTESTENGILKRLAPLRGYLYSFVITIFIGVLVGTLSQPGLTSEQRLDNLGFWVVSIAIGYLSHVCVLLLFLWADKIPTEKTFAGYLPAMASGAGFTALIMFGLTLRPQSDLESILLLLANVLALSLIVQVFLFQSVCYNLLSETQKEKLKKKLRKASQSPKANFILLEISSDETLQIYHESLRVITINDHYLTYFYEIENKTKEVTLYGSLKTVEEQLKMVMVKVNRSTLVNLSQIEDFSKTEKGIKVVGIKEIIKIPETRIKELKQLIESWP